MKFIDREADMVALEQEYRAKRASLVILYGRRRIGKTTLIKKFLSGKRGLYFLATEESEEMNRLAFQHILADFLQDDLLASARVDRWEPLFQQLIKTTHGERIVIALDEFQYLGKSNAAFLTVFQRIWDTILAPANVMVILCGSLISMMLSQTLPYDSPLYGRRTAQIHLRPVPFSHYAEFFSEPLARDKLIKRYSITGGIPKYIESIDFSSGLLQAVENDILIPSDFLFDEPNFLLQKEVSDIGSYFAILRVIAAGNHKLSKIATALGQKQSSLPRYLKVLIDLDILSREVPVTEEHPEKSKRGLYQIKDNYLRFWFQFVYPYLSYIEMGHNEIVRQHLRQNFIDRHVSFVYESICQEKLWQVSAEGKVPTLERVGRWWDNAHEIDVVGLAPQDSLLILGECKFWKGEIGINVLQMLEKKARYVNWQNENRNILYLLFSIHGFTDELKELAAVRSDILLMT